MTTVLPERRVSEQDIEAMVRYYVEAGPDYEAWSSAFNMHFGCWEADVNPLNREAMLERMNERVTAPLEDCRRVLDLGSGLGATARSLAARSERVRVTGVTVVPWQVARARQLTPSGERVDFREDDYTQTGFDDDEFDGAYAIESFCHGPGRDKAACIAEAYRVLKPGGRIVIADGFLKKTGPLRGLLAACHRRICRCWSMDSLSVLPEVLACLEDTGFEITAVEDVSWRVAFSVAHVPFVTIGFLTRELLAKRSKLSRERWNNLLAPLLTAVVGLARAHFGYYIVRAEKMP
jgi:ubiquinone/menaquinone biosynthesis C-methylase UbiE